MLSYCLKCKKNTESINPRVSATSNGRTMILSKCAICGSKKSNESAIKSIPQNEQLSEELHKPIIRKFIKRKYIQHFWGADLADMQLISKFNKGFRFLLCVIDIYSKYAWVVPLKDKKGVSIVNAFQSILNKSNRKPNKIWVDKGNEFYNTSM